MNTEGIGILAFTVICVALVTHDCVGTASTCAQACERSGGRMQSYERVTGCKCEPAPKQVAP